MAARTHLALSIIVSCGLVTGCGWSPFADNGRQAAPRMPVDAPAMRAPVSGLGGSSGAIPSRPPGGEAVIPTGSPPAAPSPAAQTAPPAIALAGGGAGSGDMAGRLDRIEADIAALQAQMRSAEPAISRLMRIDGDIRTLLSQMERVVAARAQEPGKAPPVTVPTRSAAAQPVPGAPSAVVPLGDSAPVRPLAGDAPPAAGALRIGEASPGALRLTPPDSPRMEAPASPAASPAAAPLPAPAPMLAPAPAMTAPPAAPQAPAMAAPARPPAPPAGQQGALHLASYKDLSTALNGWRVLSRRYPAELERLKPTISRIDFGDGRGAFLRLYAAGLSLDEARRVCDRLKQAGQYCIAAPDDGVPIERAAAPGSRPPAG